jgi:hypothetical protein
MIGFVYEHIYVLRVVESFSENLDPLDATFLVVNARDSR